MTDATRGLRWLRPLERSTAPELLDGTVLEPEELRRNLRDIRRVNRFFGGTSLILEHLPPIVAAIPPDRPIAVLDLATGSADIPARLVAWARERGRSVEIVASDFSDEILAVARDHVRDHADIRVARYDARAVSLPDGSADIVLCSLALHHFSPDDAVAVLREMRRLATYGFIVNDLRRSRVGYVAAWLAARLTTRNRLTRHDAPLSVLRAYTPAELGRLLERAGIDDARVGRHAWFRMAAVKVMDDGHA